MSQEDFFLDVRRALSEMKPTVSADSAGFDSQQAVALLTGAATWLTPRAVEAFDATEFAGSQRREALSATVEAFRKLAEEVRPDRPASEEQLQEGIARFRQLVLVLREEILAEWTAAIEQLMTEAASWSSQRGWPSRREKLSQQERLLDRYELTQLFIQVRATTYLLAPVARFVPGAIGMVDFTVLPSYHTVIIPRTPEGWWVHIDDGSSLGTAGKMAWGQESFVTAVEWLGRRA
ncbi:MAG: hypothetical protein GXY83_34325 [Rhodopirellula sp.]|nr:hypothetical protein [Rhodopirellula sp.]